MTTIETDDIPQLQTQPIMAEHELRCCCGRPSCAFLERNNAALGGLERELDMAGRMGKVRTSLRLLVQLWR
jgi:hypothetical protein